MLTVIIIVFSILTVIRGQDSSEVDTTNSELANYRCRKYDCLSRRAKICQLASSAGDVIKWVDASDSESKCKCCFDKNTGRKAIRKIWSKARKEVNKGTGSGDDGNNNPTTTVDTIQDLMTMQDIAP